VKPLDFPLLADDNIAPDVVKGLRARGCDVRTADEQQLTGRPDIDVLELAISQGRVVVTHDLGFGRSAISADTPIVGIVYLRPGHISATFVLGVIDALRGSAVDLEPPFVVVVERREATVRVRARTEPPW